MTSRKVHLSDGVWTRCGLRSNTATADPAAVTCWSCMTAAPSMRGYGPWPERIAGKPWCRSCGMSEGHWPGCSDA